MVAPAVLGAARPRAAPECPAGRKAAGGSGRPAREPTRSCAVPQVSPGGGLGGAPHRAGPSSPAPGAGTAARAPVPAPLRLGAAPARRSREQRKFRVPAPQPALGWIQSLTSCWQSVPFLLQRLSEPACTERITLSWGAARCRSWLLPSGHRDVSPRGPARRGRGSRPACCFLAGATDDSRGSGTHRWLRRWKVVPRINK